MNKYSSVIKSIALLFYFIILISCNNKSINNDIANLSTKPMNLPKVIINSSLNKYKLIVYSDSLGCTYCDMKNIGDWEPYVEYGNSVSDKLIIYFIFCPLKNEIRLVKNTLASIGCNYNIIIDEQNDFEKLNPHLPKNKAMHTFLLDENNKVILVGNPLYNKEIEKLFYKIMQEKLGK